MLLELRVENYAVIDHLAAEFAPGLNLLSGETGAGKSLVIDALGLLGGEKSSAEMVRQGAEKAVLSAVFAAPGGAVARALAELGLEAGDDQHLILRREISANGRSRVFINDQPATVAALRRLAPALAAIHAQRESLATLDDAGKLELVDRFAQIELATVEQAFAEWSQLRSRLGSLENDEQDRLRMADLWRFQKKEIEEFHLEAGEDARLEQERSLLANAEKLFNAAMTAYGLLYDSAGSAAESLRAASRSVEELARVQPQFSEMAASLESARITAEDAAQTLRQFSDTAQASPERLAQVEGRLAAIEKLKRKYGATLDAVIAYGEEAARKLHEVDARDDVLNHLRAALLQAAAQYRRAADEASHLRKSAARELEQLVEAEINELAMKARFKIVLGGSLKGNDDEQHWTAAGYDTAEFLIAANAGEPLGPLDKIASGGELSRAMLALKVSVERGSAQAPKPHPRKAAHGGAGPSANGKSATRAAPEAARTLVFDEIDIGIGGRAAEAVGRKLKTLAASNQVLCVTHLPQIASFADRHYRIEKCESGGRTRTSIRLLNPAERAAELARMMSGSELTESSLRHAEQLLKANA